MTVYRGRNGHHGCLVPVEIQPDDNPARYHPEPAVGHFAQVDTGSTETLLSSQLAGLLRLEPLGTDLVETPHGVFDCIVYSVAIDLVVGEGLRLSTERRRLANAIEVFEFDALYDDYSMVLGRNALAGLRLALDGPARSFEISLD